MTEPVGPKVILCVDDNPTSLYTRQLILARSGYCVVAAGNGEEGLRLARLLSLDAVILDYYLPDMDGPSVAKSLKHIHPKIPILVFSGDTRIPEDLTVWADGFLTKDCGPGVLLRELARLLRQGGV